MSVLSSYILKRFFLAVLFMTLGITALIAIFDLLAQAGRITAGNEDDLRAIGAYLVLRLPLLLTIIIPFGVLLGTMSTLSRLAAGQEIVAVSAAGITVYRLTKILLTGALVIAGIHFFIANVFTPNNAQRLMLWEKNDFQGAPPQKQLADLPGWFADEDLLIYVGDGSLDGKRLYDLRIVQRNQEGLMLQYHRVNMAVYKDGQWLYYGNDYVDFSRFNQETDAAFPKLNLKPEDFVHFGGAPEFIGFIALTAQIFAPDPPGVYMLEWQRRISWPVSSLIMVLLAAPLGFRLIRQDGVYLTSFAIITAGFIYFITDQLLFTLSESGYLPGIAGVWSTMIIFGLFSWWILLTKQE